VAAGDEVPATGLAIEVLTLGEVELPPPLGVPTAGGTEEGVAVKRTPGVFDVEALGDDEVPEGWDVWEEAAIVFAQGATIVTVTVTVLTAPGDVEGEAAETAGVERPEVVDDVKNMIWLDGMDDGAGKGLALASVGVNSGVDDARLDVVLAS